MPTYRTDKARPFMTKKVAGRVSTATWIYRLTYNAYLEQNQSYYRFMQRRNLRLNETGALRRSHSDIQKDISSLRRDDPGFAVIPVTSARLAADEARIAVDGCIKKWRKSENARYPRFRSSRQAQLVRFTDFSKPKIKCGKLTTHIMGIGLFRVRLHREPPEGGELREIRIIREGASISAQLIWQTKAPDRVFDPLETGMILHAALRHLAEDAPPGDILEALAGLPVAGADLGLTKPLTSHDGIATKRVAVPKAERLARVALQQAIARKPNKRSRRRAKAKAALGRLHRKHANRARTRSRQDAAWLNRDKILVATEPSAMARRLMGQVPDGMKPRTDKTAHMLRRRMHETGWGQRLRRIKHLAKTTGAIHVEVDHKGTSQECSRCGTVVPKTLHQRWHLCHACGLSIDRDQNSGCNVLVRAVRPFIGSADPNGWLAKEAEQEAVDLLRAHERATSRSAAIKASWDRRRGITNGAVVCPRQDSVLQNIGAEKDST